MRVIENWEDRIIWIWDGYDEVERVLVSKVDESKIEIQEFLSDISISHDVE